ncbi:MAG TPA: ROK family protein [Chthoniobacterales bacterium]|nr:ROK family protein [Chthoniobacterales bacterium]
MQAKAAIGLDVGGTRVKAVVVEDEGTVLDQVVRQSLDNGVERWAEVAQALVQELIEQYGEELFVGVCAAGLADSNESCIWNLPNRMPGIEGLNWQRFLSRPRAVPALNDGQAALLGERWLGAAAGRQNVIMLTLGTGVGGAAIVDGRLLRGARGRAGHFGHVSIRDTGLLDIVGTPGSLEDAVGNQTVNQRSEGLFSDTRALLTACRRQESNALQVWDRMLSDLARGLVSLINVLDPDLVLLGGGISIAGDELIQGLRQRLGTWEWRPGGLGVELAFAKLGAWAGAFGAAARAMQIY